MKKKRLLTSFVLLLVSSVLLSTASFAWFSINEKVNVSGFQFEAYSDQLFLEIAEAKDGEYVTELDFSNKEKQSLRLVTLGRLPKEGGLKIEASAPISRDSQTGEIPRYSSANNINYYQMVKSIPDSKEQLEGINYICINSKLHDASPINGYYKYNENSSESSILFNLLRGNSVLTEGDETVYYDLVGNTYIKMSLADDDGVLDADELELGTPLKGYYTITLGDYVGKGEETTVRYDGKSRYYKVDPDGNISPVGGLKLGSSLEGYYTLTEVERDTEDGKTEYYQVADGDSKYYLKNGRGDYICIGTPEEGTDLTDYYFWGHAYSSALGEHQPDNISNILNVIKTEQSYQIDPRLGNYCLRDAFFLRLNPATDENWDDGENLRIGAVTVDGDDSLTEAIRVYVKAKNGDKVSRAIFNNRTGEITYLDGTDLDGDEKADNLFDIIRGGAEPDIVEVEIYIYFDGTDPSAVTGQNVELSGHSVSVKFEIDTPDYYQPE